LYGDPYFVVFILVLLIFIIAVVVISLFSFRKRTAASSPTLGSIRQQIEGIQKSVEDMQRQVWQYGDQ
jgi:cell division protein FtsL